MKLTDTEANILGYALTSVDALAKKIAAGGVYDWETAKNAIQYMRQMVRGKEINFRLLTALDKRVLELSVNMNPYLANWRINLTGGTPMVTVAELLQQKRFCDDLENKIIAEGMFVRFPMFL